MLVLGLLGALGVTVGSSRPWASAQALVTGLPPLHATATGSDLAPAAGALGVVMLAAFGAVIATRGRVRQALAVLVFAASVAVLVAALDPARAHGILAAGLSAKGWTGAAFSTSTEPWRWLVVVSSVACAVAGAATSVHGRRWATMGSKYDAPGAPDERVTATPAEMSEAQAWRAIDLGDDPTQARVDQHDTIGPQREEPNA
ncbi:MAG: Trp biosynthesis-associated membrane protein [Nocardioidaceae bacterium]